MKEKINVSISVFEKNFKMAKHAYVLNSSMEACGCASAFIGDTEPMNEDRFLRSKLVVKKSTGILSTLGRGNARQIVAATIAAEEDPQTAMNTIAEIHRKLDKKFFNSDYLVLSAIMIFKNCKESEYNEVIARTREIYTLERKAHPLITSREDLVNITLMALSGIKPESVVARAEQNFEALKSYYHLKNKIQYLSCMLSIFDGLPQDRAVLAKDTQQCLKTYGIRFDSYGMPIIGALSALVARQDLDTVCASIRDTSERLKKIRGMGSFGAGKQIRNMIATAIVIDAYTSDSTGKIKNSVSSAIISAIIAVEIACIVAASAAASASASSASS
jgi:hypothetical protein